MPCVYLPGPAPAVTVANNFFYRHIYKSSPTLTVQLGASQVNEVSQFMYSRPFKRATSRHEEENEFASLWVERTLLRTAYQAPVYCGAT